MQRYINNKYVSTYKPTIGADFLSKDIQFDDTTVTIQIWDTAGQERYQSLGAAFYKGSDGCAISYDVTDLKSFESVSKWKDDFLAQLLPKDAEKFPFILIGNKVDKETERKIPSIKAESWCKQFGNIKFFETSAKDSINVNESIDFIAKLGYEYQMAKFP